MWLITKKKKIGEQNQIRDDSGVGVSYVTQIFGSYVKKKKR